VGPAEYFQQHPRRYWLALAGPDLTTGYALARLRRATDRPQALRYAALAALTAVQAVGLARIHPGRNASWRRDTCSRSVPRTMR
jgi:hypothetical protein